jgi:hypothetical protein
VVDSEPRTTLVNPSPSLAGNPVNFPDLARVGPLFEKKVARPQS